MYEDLLQLGGSLKLVKMRWTAVHREKSVGLFSSFPVHIVWFGMNDILFTQCFVLLNNNSGSAGEGAAFPLS